MQEFKRVETEQRVQRAELDEKRAHAAKLRDAILHNQSEVRIKRRPFRFRRAGLGLRRDCGRPLQMERIRQSRSQTQNVRTQLFREESEHEKDVTLLLQRYPCLQRSAGAPAAVWASNSV